MRRAVVQEVAVVVAVDKDCSMQVEATLLGVRCKPNMQTSQERTGSRKPLSRIVFDVTCTEPVRKSE